MNAKQHVTCREEDNKNGLMKLPVSHALAGNRLRKGNGNEQERPGNGTDDEEAVQYAQEHLDSRCTKLARFFEA